MESRDVTFSIIIPTYGRPDALLACVGALSELDYPRDRFEVIIVDDGGTIPLETVLASVADRLRLKIVWQPNAGPAAARNRGARQATGAVLAFTDDDCVPAPSWLRAIETALSADETALVGGRTMNRLQANPYAAASQLIIDVVYAHYNGQLSRAQFFASNNMAMPTEIFRAINGFDESFRTSEDRDLCDRVLATGYPLRYAPEAVVWHAHQLTWRTFWNQHEGYGRGAWRYHTARALRGTGKFRPDWRFYWALARAPFLSGWTHSMMRGAALLLMAQLANAAGCLKQATEGRFAGWSRRVSWLQRL